MDAGGGDQTRSTAPWANAPWTLPVVLLVHVVAWTAYACIAQSAGAVHHDMTEAWSWGREFRFGYYKHPPFFAWVAGLWFEIFPRTDAFYYLLSQVNSGLGLAGVWMLAGRFLAPNGRLAAVLLLSMAPFNNVMAINYNANAILLSLWPWTAFAFVRAMETGRALHGALFGVLAGAALLSKYFSILLLAGCFLASLLHPRFAEIYRSPAPYVGIAVCLVVLVPHLSWLHASGGPSIEYAAQKATAKSDVALYKVGTTVAASFALLALPALALWAAYGREVLGLYARAAVNGARRGTAWIAVLCLAPFAFTVLFGLFGSVKISTNFMTPVFVRVPLTLLALAGVAVPEAPLRTIAKGALLYPLGALLASPAIAWALFDRQIDLAAEPRAELAQVVTQDWRQAFGQPLLLVAGTNAYGTGVVFYSKDSPHEFTRLNHAQAPWVTHERLQREGVAIICIDKDADCVAKAAALMTPQSRQSTVVLRRSFLGRAGPAHGFEVFLVPPGPIPPVREPLQYRGP